MTDRPYSRIYHELAEEFPEVYDGNDLAGYVRLLVAADQAHPSRARWAGYVSRPVLKRLAAAGLVVVDGARFAIKGMDKERAARSEQARRAAEARYAKSTADSNAESSAAGMPRREEKRQDETKRDETSRDAASVYYDLKGGQVSEKTLAFIDRIVEKHGNDAVIQMLGRLSVGRTDFRDLLSDVSRQLDLEAHNAEAQRQKEAEARAKSRAIEEQRERQAAFDAMTPEEQAAARARFDEVRKALPGVGKEMA